MRQQSVVVFVAGTVCGAALLAGCGGSSSGAAPASSAVGSTSPAAGGAAEERKPASQVLADAKRHLLAAKAVHVAGTGSDGKSTEQLDIHAQGDDFTGTLTMAGEAVQIVRSQKQEYLKAPTAFWTQYAGAKGASLGGKWITLPTSTQQGFGSFTLSGIATSTLDASDSPLKAKTATAQRAGQRVIVLTQQNGDQLYVTDSGTPVPVALVNRQQGDAATLAFTDYGTLITISAPAGAETPNQAAAGG